MGGREGFLLNFQERKESVSLFRVLSMLDSTRFLKILKNTPRLRHAPHSSPNQLDATECLLRQEMKNEMFICINKVFEAVPQPIIEWCSYKNIRTF